MKRTGWYNGDQKPVRVGEYERSDYTLYGFIDRDWWDGELWLLAEDGYAIPEQHLPWRGLTKELK